MLKKTLTLSLGLIFMNTGQAHNHSRPHSDKREAQNKKIVLNFYNKAINEKNFPAARRYLGRVYTQHNPMVVDGPEGLKAFIAYLKKNYPKAHSTVKRAFTQGDFVILHLHSRLTPEDRGRAIVDIFRLKHKKIVEHWDVIQPIPEGSKNKNGMF